MADVWEMAADAVPGREALVVGDRRLTYRELDGGPTGWPTPSPAAASGPGDHMGLHL